MKKQSPNQEESQNEEEEPVFVCDSFEVFIDNTTATPADHLLVKELKEFEDREKELVSPYIPRSFMLH